MNELLPSVVVVVLGVAWMFAAITRFSGGERTWVWLGFFGHLAGAIGNVAITRYVYRGGDMLEYHHLGSLFSRLLFENFARYAPQMLSYIGQQEVAFAQGIGYSGTPTGSMIGLSAFVLFIVGGSSLFAACLLMGTLAHFAQLAIYRALRRDIPSELRPRAAAVCLTLPSVVFWTSGLVKESVVMIGLGLLVSGMVQVVRDRRWGRGLPLCALGMVPLAFIKPYVLFAFFIAAAWWTYMNAIGGDGRIAKVLSRPLVLVSTAAGVAIGLTVLGLLFPRFALDNIAEEAARLQHFGTVRAGTGSNYEFGDTTQNTAQAQLSFAPLGLLYALVRPVPFEVHNPMMLVNSIETGVLTCFLFLSLRRKGLQGFWSALTQSHVLSFCVTFVIVFGAAVGIATTNVGTLSRYRVPMMPFYALALFLMSRPQKVERAVPRRGAG